MTPVSASVAAISKAIGLLRFLPTLSVLTRLLFFFSSRRRHTRCSRDWSSDVCSSDLVLQLFAVLNVLKEQFIHFAILRPIHTIHVFVVKAVAHHPPRLFEDLFPLLPVIHFDARLKVHLASSDSRFRSSCGARGNAAPGRGRRTFHRTSAQTNCPDASPLEEVKIFPIARKLQTRNPLCSERRGRRGAFRWRGHRLRNLFQPLTVRTN